MLEKIVVALASGAFSAVLAYGLAANRYAGRLDAIERAVQRIEQHLYRTVPPIHHPQKGASHGTT